MVVQQPGVVDQGLQNQRLAAGHRAALAAHDRAGRELGAGRLVGARTRSPGLPPAPGPRPPRGANWPAWPWLKPLRGAKRRGDSPPPAPRKLPLAVAAAAAFRRKRALQALGQILAIVTPHDLVADAVGRVRRCALPAPRAARAWQSCRPRSRATRACRTSGRAAEITSSIATRPPERARSSGSCPSGSSAKRRLFPGSSAGSARSAARYAAFCPARSPSKQRIGSSAIFHSSASWFSVSAVPSGATAPPKPAVTMAMTST